jgi:hypothetical protein
MHRKDTNIQSLNCCEFIVHIIHYLRQDSSGIEASVEMLARLDENNLEDNNKKELRDAILKKVHSIHFLENEIKEWLDANYL